MRSLKPSSIVAIVAFVSLGHVAQAQMAPVNTKFFAANAGKFDANGWTDAMSTEGGYSVRLPCRYHDFTVLHEKSGNSGGNKEYVLFCDRPDGVRFYVTRVEALSGEAGSKGIFENYMTGKVIPFDRVEPLTFKGLSAGQGKKDSDGRCVYATFATFKADHFLLAVEPLKARVDCSALEPDASKFFDSFAVPSK